MARRRSARDSLSGSILVPVISAAPILAANFVEPWPTGGRFIGFANNETMFQRGPDRPLAPACIQWGASEPSFSTWNAILLPPRYFLGHPERGWLKKFEKLESRGLREYCLRRFRNFSRWCFKNFQLRLFEICIYHMCLFTPYLPHVNLFSILKML